MKKYVSALLIVCVAIVIAFYADAASGGDISNVTRRMYESQVYNTAEINAAMNMVEQKFKDSFVGCRMTEIWYDDYVSNASARDYARQFGYVEAIVILSDFIVDENGAGTSFLPGETYENWQWVLVRNTDDSSWELKTWGFQV